MFVDMFEELNEHDKDQELLMEDIHSTQLIKTIVNKYLTMRCHRYGQQIHEGCHPERDDIQKGKHGFRQQANKLVLFNGL